MTSVIQLPKAFGDGTAQWIRQENLRAVLMEFGEEDSEDNKKTWIQD